MGDSNKDFPVLTVSRIDQMVPRLIDSALFRQMMHLRSVQTIIKIPLQSQTPYRILLQSELGFCLIKSSLLGIVPVQR